MRIRLLCVLFVFVAVGSASLFGWRTLGQDYSTYLEIDEGSVICRQGIMGPGAGPMLSYDAWLKDPRQEIVGSDYKISYTWRLDGQYSIEPATSGTYTCYVQFNVDGNPIGGIQQQSKFVNNCGDERGNIIKEYHDKGVDLTPVCSDFTQSVPSQSHYSFNQWNSGSYSWALLQTSVTDNTWCVVMSHGSTPTFSSGYRNPVHNESVGGATNSRHVYGDAVDLDTPTAPNDTLYDSLRSIAKGGFCGVACVEPRAMSPSHYHGDYRGGCPTGW